jgi:hypothetical protein
VLALILRSAGRVVHFRQVLGSREMNQDEDRMRHEVPPTERMVAEIRSPTRGVEGARNFSKKVTENSLDVSRVGLDLRQSRFS